MNKQISKKQSKYIEAEMEMKKDSDEYTLTKQDRILEMFLPIKAGIVKNGLTAPEIAEKLGAQSYKDMYQIRTEICSLVSKLMSKGFPFGGLKDGRLKKYGFSNTHEYEEIAMSRKKRMVQEISAGTKYLDNADPLLPFCERFIEQCDKQLKLFYEE